MESSMMERKIKNGKNNLVVILKIRGKDKHTNRTLYKTNQTANLSVSKQREAGKADNGRELNCESATPCPRPQGCYRWLAGEEREQHSRVLSFTSPDPFWAARGGIRQVDWPATTRVKSAV